MVKVTESEAWNIRKALWTYLLVDSFPPWSGDPRRPEPSRYSDANIYARHPLRPLSFLPVDDWVSKAAEFKPLRHISLSSGPYQYVREYISGMSVGRTSKELQHAAKTIDDFTDAIQQMAEAFVRLLQFARNKDFNDPIWTTLVHWVGILDTRRLHEDIVGKAVASQRSRRLETYMRHLDTLLSEDAANAIDGLLEIASEARAVVPLHKGRGPAPALWRKEFVSQLAHLWRNLYGELPGSNSDHPFIGLVEAVWQTALVCVESPRVSPSMCTPVQFSRERLDELSTLNWERKVREALAEMRKDTQYNQ